MNSAMEQALSLAVTAIMPIVMVIVAQNLLIRWLMPLIGHSRLARTLYFTTATVGVPIHEISHLIVALLFRHKIRKVKLFEFSPAHGRLGYVEHEWDSRSPWQTIGLFFIGVAPLAGTTIVIGALAYHLVPSLVDGYQYALSKYPINATHLSLQELVHSLWYSAVVAGVLLTNIALSNEYLMWLGLASIIAFHAVPSRADLRSSAKGGMFFLTLLTAIAFFFYNAPWLNTVLSYWISSCVFLSALIVLSTVWWVAILSAALVGKSLSLCFSRNQQ